MNENVITVKENNERIAAFADYIAYLFDKYKEEIKNKMKEA